MTKFVTNYIFFSGIYLHYKKEIVKYSKLDLSLGVAN